MCACGAALCRVQPEHLGCQTNICSGQRSSFSSSRSGGEMLRRKGAELHSCEVLNSCGLTARVKAKTAASTVYGLECKRIPPCSLLNLLPSRGVQSSCCICGRQVGMGWWVVQGGRALLWSQENWKGAGDWASSVKAEASCPYPGTIPALGHICAKLDATSLSSQELFQSDR